MKVTADGVSELKKSLATIKGEMPFASALAQTRTVTIMWKEEKKQMEKDLDRPTPFSVNALIYQKATKQGKKARLWFKDRFGSSPGYGPKDYLGVQIVGGRRGKRRRSEKIFQSIGDAEFRMPRGTVWTPDAKLKLNKYGNVSPGLIVKILANFGAKVNKGFGKPKQTKYVMNNKGIYQVMKNDLKPVLWFVPSPSYKKRFKFYEKADDVMEENFEKEFGRAIDDALEKAK